MTGGRGARSAGSGSEVAALVRLAVATIGGSGLVVALIVALAPARSRPPGYHTAAVTLLSAAVMVVAGPGRRRSGLYSPAGLDVLLPIGAVVLAALALLAGPAFGSLATMFFVWYGTSVGFLPLRRAVALMVWVAAVLAVVLTVQRGVAEPVARWEMVIGIMAFVALATNQMVERVRTTARGEQAARAAAERARAELEVTSAEKSRYVARMSHELRTPLNAVIGFSEMLARRSFGELNAKQAEYVADVVDSGQHLLALVDDLLDLAKVETGVLELDAAPVDVTRLLTNSLALFKEQAGRKQVTLALDADPAVGTVEADDRKLKQVVFNLLANAVRFTPPGGRVTVRSWAGLSGIAISVTDTGPGIAPEAHDAVFEEYRQGTSAGDGPRGTGLGLPMARRLVELHGGRLTLASPGAGATFTLELPAPVAVPAAAPTAGPTGGPAPAGPRRSAEPDTPERRGEHARLLRTVMGALLPIGVVVLLTLRLHPPHTPSHFRPWPLIAAMVVDGLVMVALWARPQRMGGRAGIASVCALGIAVLTVCLRAVDATLGDPGFTYSIVIVVVGGFLVVTQRQLAAEVGLVGIGYAVTLHEGTGFGLPVARWVAAMAFVAVTGIVLRRLMVRLEAGARAEREARRQAEQLAAAVAVAGRRKTEFLANMSHELRTPLNVIIGFSEVLEGQVFGPLNEKQAEYVGDVLSSGRHLLALINDILDLAKLEAGRMELNAHPADVTLLVDEAVSPLRRRAARRGVELDLTDGSGPGAVTADEAKLVQSVALLVSHALEVTPGGGRVRVGWGRAAGGLAIAVHDGGEPIPAADRERIFDAFAGSVPSSGSGLGLALARRYAELHGGTLTVAPGPGGGNVFTVCLPDVPGPVRSPAAALS